MKHDRPAILAIAIVVAALLIGGTSGVIAHGLIGTSQLKNGAVTTPKIRGGAVTSPKIRNGSVTTADIATSARGAKVIHYVASGALLDSQDNLTIDLPGTWTPAKIAKSSWSVQLLRNNGQLFPLGSASTSIGESSANGFTLSVASGVAQVHIYGPSYAVIDEVRIVRTIATRTSAAGTVQRAQRPQARAGN